MSTSESPRDPKDAAWREHNLQQLRWFRSLTLREKMQAVEEMCRVHLKFEQMRKDGLFRSASERKEE